MSFPRASQFPSAAAAAFGSSKRVEHGPSRQQQFSQEASEAFSRKKQQAGFDAGAAMAFSKEVKPNVGNTFTAFSKGPQPTNNFDNAAMGAFGKGPQPTNNFDNAAMGAFGKGPRSHNGFDTMASAAFGKKPSRMERAQEERSRSTLVLPKRANDLGSIMDHYLGPTEREYGNSALTQRRKAAAAVPEKIEEMVWPELAPSKTAMAAVAKPAVSFAELMKKRVIEEEAAAAEEANKKAEAAAAKKRDALDRPSIVPHRFRPVNHVVNRAADDYEEEQVEDNDVDYLSPSERRKHDYELPTEDDHYDQVDGHDEELQADDEDDYYRR